MQDWLPEGHLAHFISDTVDMLDLGAIVSIAHRSTLGEHHRRRWTLKPNAGGDGDAAYRVESSVAPT